MEKATHPTSVGPAALKAESFVKTTRPARAVARTQAAFVESMECLGVATLPEGPNWTYEIKYCQPTIG